MEKVKYHKFQHTVNFGTYDKTVDFYSNEGSYIPVFKYWQLRNAEVEVTDQEIWMNHAKRFEDNKPRQDKWPDIRSLKELMTYIFGQLDKKEQDKIKAGKEKTEELKDLIKLFPEVYRGILLLRLDYDNKVGQKSTKKMDNVVSTIGRNYNPDAFIESSE